MEEKQVYVESLEQFKKLCSIRKYAQFYLIFGGFHTVKRIRYFPRKNTFNIIHGVDNSRQIDISPETLYAENRIPEAIENNALLRVFE
jgi:hypothetical protein